MERESWPSGAYVGRGLGETGPLGSPGKQRRLAGNAWRRLGDWVRDNTFAPSWLPARLRHPAFGYLAAVILEVVAVALTLLLVTTFSGLGYRSLIVIAAVVLVALTWGGAPSLMATLVGVALLNYVVFPPRFSWALATASDFLSVGLVLAVGLLISLVGGQVARARRQTDQARQGAETQAAQLRTIFETLEDGVFVYDQEGYIIQQNSAACTLLGQDQFSGPASWTLVERLMHLALRDAQGRPLSVDGSMTSRMLRGEVFTGETAQDVWMRSLDGREIFVSITGAPICNRHGQITGAVTLARDITERHRLEQEVAARARELETILDTITDGVFVFDTAGRDLRLNRAALAQRRRHAPPDCLKRLLVERAAQVEAFDVAGHRLSLEEQPGVRLLRGETLSEANGVDIITPTLEGKNRRFNISGAPLLNGEGQQVGAVVVSRDVTERWWLEQRTQRALDALIQLAYTLVTALAEEATLPGVLAQRLAAFTTEALGEEHMILTGRDPETGMLYPVVAAGLAPEQEARWRSSLKGMRLDEWWGPEVAARLEAGEVVQIVAADAVLLQGTNLFGMQRRLLAPLLSERHLIGFLALGRPETGPPFTPQEETLLGTVAHLCALALEHERLLRAREEARVHILALRGANEQMDAFLGIAGHELKTPLTSLKLAIQMAQRAVERLSRHEVGAIEALSQAVPKLQEQLARTPYQIKRLNRLVDDLLDVSRIQANRLELHMDAVDLISIVQQIVEEQQEAAPTRTIQVQLPASHLLLRADADRIGQVVTNYLTNALKYSPANQPVEVSVELHEQHARVWVRDRGPGIPAAEQAHLWERFYRVPGIEVQSGSGVGLGMGLYICRSIIEQHGGQVGVQSAPGEGATFWFTLPLEPEDEPATSNGNRSR